jgi:hypothetical protein
MMERSRVQRGKGSIENGNEARDVKPVGPLCGSAKRISPGAHPNFLGGLQEWRIGAAGLALCDLSASVRGAGVI